MNNLLIAFIFLFAGSANAAYNIFTSDDNEKTLNVGGSMKFDHVSFSSGGSPTKTSLSALDFSVSGDLNSDWKFTTIITGLAAENPKVGLAHLTYSGLSPRSSLVLGKITLPYDLSNSWSGGDLPYMQRNICNSNIATGVGIGAKYSANNDNVFFSAGVVSVEQKKNKIEISDGWNSSMHLAVAPVIEDDQVFHVGAFGSYGKLDLKKFDVKSELGTKTLSGEVENLRNYRTIGTELAFSSGPFYIEAEGVYGFLKKQSGSEIKQSGYHVQTVLTLLGGNRNYDIASGSFKGVEKSADYGSLEFSSRYSYVNLNSRGAYDSGAGGFMHSVTLGLKWVASDNITHLFNYVPYRNNNKDSHSGFGYRLALSF